MKLGIIRTENRTDDGRWQVWVQPPKWAGNFPAKLVILTDAQFERYKLWLSDDGYIQRWLPDLTPVEREILLNGDPDEI
jgi:hypothetical protein